MYSGDENIHCTVLSLCLYECEYTSIISMLQGKRGSYYEDYSTNLYGKEAKYPSTATSSTQQIQHQQSHIEDQK